MDTDLQEPPLSPLLNRMKDKGDAPKIFAKIWPAISGSKRFSDKVLGFSRKTGIAAPNFIKTLRLHKSLVYQLILLLVLAALPWISEASANQQAISDSIHYSQPLDPIEAGRLAVYWSQYTPGVYVDADEVALSLMTANDNATLTQQLSINADKNIEVPGREAAAYTLQPGETIAQVAIKFHLHVGTIVDANNLQPTELKKIKPGTILTIPSSDTNTSDDWLVAINQAEEQAKQQAAQQAAAAAKKKQAATTQRLASAASLVQHTVGSISSEVTIIGTSFEQCVPWAREQTGIGIHGYAGDVQPNASEPKVGAIALDRFFGHASVVVDIGDNYIIVHEANWIRGKITERKVSKAAIRGYVY
jgi:LysM repeat protein